MLGPIRWNEYDFIYLIFKSATAAIRNHDPTLTGRNERNGAIGGQGQRLTHSLAAHREASVLLAVGMHYRALSIELNQDLQQPATARSAAHVCTFATRCRRVVEGAGAYQGPYGEPPGVEGEAMAGVAPGEHARQRKHDHHAEDHREENRAADAGARRGRERHDPRILQVLPINTASALAPCTCITYSVTLQRSLALSAMQRRSHLLQTSVGSSGPI